MTITDELIQYSNDVIEGRVVSCVKHKWACQRFINDLNRQGQKDFPYIFDEDKANRFLKWMTFFKHTKGPLAGEYKIPEPIEKFIFGNIYGWVHEKTGYRRFRKAYWQVARKNAKSQDNGIIGLYEMACMDEPSAEVYVAATKKSQTRYVWGEADLMVKGCKYLEGKIKTKFYQPLLTTVILHLKTGSFFDRMSKDDKKNGDGSNPQCGILDEYHAHPTSEFYDILTSGMKTRKQPLLMIITTAGFELNYPCYREEYRYVSSILDPDNEIENGRYFAMINELDKNEEGDLIDDVHDEKCWEKANPIIANTPEGLDAIRDELKVATDKPEKMRDFLTKTMDVWCADKVKGYMNLAKWKTCGATKEIPFPDLKGMKCNIGIDLTSKLDLASVVFHFDISELGLQRKVIINDEELIVDITVAVKQHSFMPEAAYMIRMGQKKMPWDIWKKRGYITVTPGEVIDDRYITEYINNKIEANKWEKKFLGYDLYNATQFVNVMHDDHAYECVEIRQGIPTLHEPTKDFRELSYAKKVIHENDPVLNWAFGNAVCASNPQKNIMLDKGNSYDNIDPAAACMNAHCLYVRQKPKNDSPYNENRGILMI